MPPRNRSRPSSRTATQRDPLMPQGIADPRGIGPLATTPGSRLMRGTIMSVDAEAHVYRVMLNDGRPFTMGRIRSHPGDLALLPPQTIVVVTWDLGLPYIVGVLPPSVANSANATPQTVTDVQGHGGNDPALAQGMLAMGRAPDEPRDLMPGDFAGLGPDGSSVSALRGKIAQIRGSALAKIIAHGDTDTVQIIAGLYRLVSWMGESRIQNEDGKTSFVWRGGADQLTQVGADEERYTIRLDVGHTGDMIRLEVTTREGQSLFRFTVSATGACEIFAAGGLNQHGGSGRQDVHPQRFHGDREIEVEGGSSERVSGDASRNYEGNHTHTVSQNANVNVGGNQTVNVTGDRTQGVGGSDAELVSGNKTVAVVGTYRIEVRETGLYAVETEGGNIQFTPGGSKLFKIISNTNDGIQFGPASSHATLFEELSQALSAWKVEIDSRFQQLATPTSLPTLATPTTLNLNPAKAKVVKLG